MRKLFSTLIFMSLLAGPSLALAEPMERGGGFTGPDETPVVSVAEALKLGDEARVTLTGTIDKRLGPEKYQFSDRTGKITIEIEDEDWRGLTVGPNDPVVIHGEIDRDFGRREIEVKSIARK